MSHKKLAEQRLEEWRSHREGKRGVPYWRRGDGAEVRRDGRRWVALYPYLIPEPTRTAVVAMATVNHHHPVAPCDA